MSKELLLHMQITKKIVESIKITAVRENITKPSYDLHTAYQNPKNYQISSKLNVQL
jgi:hypothetical protein